MCVQGVMLTHANLFYQLDKFNFFVEPQAGNQTLSLLPPWHIYERAVGYYIFSCGCKQVRICLTRSMLIFCVLLALSNGLTITTRF